GTFHARKVVVFLLTSFYRLCLCYGWGLYVLSCWQKKIFRCLYRRCLPLPIPNRAVKPARADGTAVTGGRVGRCLILHGGTFIHLDVPFLFPPLPGRWYCPPRRMGE